MLHILTMKQPTFYFFKLQKDAKHRNRKQN